MKSRRAIFVSALLALVLVAGGSAEAASKPKKPKPSKPPVGPVWVGRIEKHGKHFDYIGQACAVGTETCIAQVVHYRIIPTTAQARGALKNFAGGTGAIWGARKSAKDHGHSGSLQAKQIDATTGQGTAPSEGGSPGTPGQITPGTPGQDTTP